MDRAQTFYGAAACAAVFVLSLLASAVLNGPAEAQVTPDLVSRTALRVCEDPSNLPFSNRKNEGFENKIADILAGQLKKPVRYLWAPSGPGFIRNTLNSDLCDIVMGYTVGAEMVQSTNPYYRSTYVLVAPAGSPLDGIETIDDPRLKGHRIGVFGGSPPVDLMLAKGLMTNAVVYPLLVDHRFDSPLVTLLGDLAAKKIDAAIVWGPLIGWDVKKSDGKLVMTPLVKDVNRPGFAYRISFGVRHDEPEWKHTIEGILRARRRDINAVLVDYGVPLLDDVGAIIPPSEAVADHPPPVEPVSAQRGEHRRERGAKTPPGFAMPGPAPGNGTPPGFKMPGPPPADATAGHP